MRDKAAIVGSARCCVGDAVEVVFDPVTPEVTIPRFTPRNPPLEKTSAPGC